jgi:AraC-like DNA-binding protein
LAANRKSGAPPLVQSAVLLGCLEAAREINADLGPILKEHGIDPQLLTSPEGFIDKPRLVRFLQSVADHFNCPHFGFLVGKYQAPLPFGQPAHLLKLAPTLSVALENIIRFVELYSQGVEYELVIDSDSVSFRRNDTYEYDTNTAQLELLGSIQVLKVFKSLCGEDWQATSIFFKQPAPPARAQLSEYFGCPVVFDMPFDGLVFPNNELARAIPSANNELLEIVDAYFTRMISEKRLEDDIIGRTKDYIRTSIGSNLCNIESCAQSLQLHPRTLQRDLSSNGYSFKQLLLEVRMELARTYLSGSLMSMTELTQILGYENLSAFSRAFKRELGVPPLQWRDQHTG